MHSQSLYCDDNVRTTQLLRNSMHVFARLQSRRDYVYAYEETKAKGSKLTEYCQAACTSEQQV